MAVTVTDNRTVMDQGDSTTGWTSAGTSTGTATGTASPTPREATAHIVTTATSSTPANQWLYFTGTSLGTGPHLIYIWMLTTATIGTRANGGLMILIGDGTNRVGYHVGGSDHAPFRIDSGGEVNYMCFVIDTDQLATWPHGVTVEAGSRATLEANLNAITQVGTGCQVLAKAVGGAVNYWNDIIRHGVATNIAVSGLTISGGTSGDPGKFSQIATDDAAITDLKAYGVIRQLGEGAFGCQGTLRFGDQGTASSWFQDSNVTVVFESRNLATSRYKIVITDNGTGTATFILTDCALIAPTGVGASFDSLTDTDVTAVTVTGTRFEGFTQGVGIGGGAGQVFTNCIFSNGGAVSVTSQPVNLSDSSVLTSTVAANASALIWNVGTNPDGLLDDMTFSKGTNAHHAIEFGTTSLDTMTLRGIAFTGFSGTLGGTTGDETLHIKRTSGTVTISLVGCSGNIGYRTDGATVVLVADPVTALVNVKDTSGANIQNARVFVKASDNTGPFPFEEPVTITNSGTTATVTHTGHGMATNDKVVISGASLEANNGIFTITVTGSNTYTYIMGSSPGDGAVGGTIISTFVAISGETDANGNISMTRVFSANQPVIGWARKHSTPPDYTPPNYKTGPIGGTINSASGFTANVQLVSDD